MKIRLLSFCWNEEFLLPYFFRHYDAFVDKYIIYDNESTDKSIEIMSNNPKVEIRNWKTNGIIDIYEFTKLRNNIWKEDKLKYDWQIVCDVDEFLYHPQLLNILNDYKTKGISVCLTRGYDMYSLQKPKTNGQIYSELQLGIPSVMFSKPVIFNPKKVVTTNYNHGAHNMWPKGQILKSSRKLKLLHYKYIGIDYVNKKGKEHAARVGKDDFISERRKKRYEDFSNLNKTFFTKNLKKCVNVLGG